MLTGRLAMPLAVLVLLGPCAQVASADCPDDPEVDLCDEEDVSAAAKFRSPVAKPVGAVLLAAMTLRGSNAKYSAWASLMLIPFAEILPTARAMTCGELKDFYKNEQCCGMPSKALSALPGPACPYNFDKPLCVNAEPQTPRDLSTDGNGNVMPGNMIPKAATLSNVQVTQLPLVNVHFHLGAEHKSDAYNDASDADAYDANARRLEESDDASERRLATGNVRPGFMCPNTGIDADKLTSYTFQYCKGQVEVGKSYEVHYVHSSAGYSQAELDANPDIDLMDDGLGGAANGKGMLNPMVAVQGQIYHIVKDSTTSNDLLHGWTNQNHADAVMYQGSTTGPSHNNEICSPYAVTWHVDQACHQVTPESFDNLCKQMKDLYNLEFDLYPHGSRTLVDPQFVVQSQYVLAYA